MKTTAIMLNNFIGSEMVELDGEKGIFIPLKYNAEVDDKGRVWARARMRKATAQNATYREQGQLMIPEADRSRIISGTGAFGKARQLVYVFGTNYKKRSGLSTTEIDELLK